MSRTGKQMAPSPRAEAIARYRRSGQREMEAFARLPIYYSNEHILVLDARNALEPIGTPWKARQLGRVEGLCVHHKGGWADYRRTNAFVRNHRKRPHKRFAYHLGAHVEASHPTSGDRSVVYLFNDLEAASWASGAPRRAASSWYKRQLDWSKQRNVNDWTVALNLNGFFGSRYYPEGSKQGRNLVLTPSREQIWAVYGVVLMLEELLENFDRSLVLGHHDVGKVACPGDVLMAFVRELRQEQIASPDDVKRFIEANAVPSGFGDDDGVPVDDVEVETVFDEDVEGIDIFEAQRRLVNLGYDLGTYGVAANGVDGVWGRMSRAALLAFEDDYAYLGTLSNGQLDEADMNALQLALAELAHG